MQIQQMANEPRRESLIEPSHAAWKAAVLPLNYTRNGRNSTIVSNVVAVTVDDGVDSNGETVLKRGHSICQSNEIEVKSSGF